MRKGLSQSTFGFLCPYFTDQCSIFIRRQPKVISEIDGLVKNALKTPEDV
jgi:hypothetical protein